MGFFNHFFKKNENNVKSFLERGAIVIDVRTKREWDKAHISVAIHIPLSDLKNHIDEIKKLNKPIIAYCKSGRRSDKATKLLKFYDIEAVNGGGMADLQTLIN